MQFQLPFRKYKHNCDWLTDWRTNEQTDACIKEKKRKTRHKGLNRTQSAATLHAFVYYVDLFFFHFFLNRVFFSLFSSIQCVSHWQLWSLHFMQFHFHSLIVVFYLICHWKRYMTAPCFIQFFNFLQFHWYLLHGAQETNNIHFHVSHFHDTETESKEDELLLLMIK